MPCMRASWPMHTVCWRAGQWRHLLRSLSWSGLRRVILEAMSVNPILPELVAADVHVVPLAAGAGAPDLNTLPAVASPGRQASW